MERTLQATIERFEAVAETKPTSLPPFTQYVAGIVVLLLVWVLLETTRSRNTQVLATNEKGDQTTWSKRPGLAIGCFLLLVAYVVMLSLGWVPMAVAASLLVAAMGGMMLRYAPGQWPVLIELALLTGLGTQFLFTEIFAIALP
jgi:hypothetical protein